MNDDTFQDKAKIQEVLDEITNLKKYCNDLRNNTRGEKLENYIDNLNKSIISLENSVQIIYEKKCK